MDQRHRMAQFDRRWLVGTSKTLDKFIIERRSQCGFFVYWLGLQQR
jgi:hypothetical protein